MANTEEKSLQTFPDSLTNPDSRTDPQTVDAIIQSRQEMIEELARQAAAEKERLA